MATVILARNGRDGFDERGCFTSLLFPIKHHYRGCPGDGGVIGDRIFKTCSLCRFQWGACVVCHLCPAFCLGDTSIFYGMALGLAPLVGRLPRPSRLLLVAAVIFVAWKPWALFYDAGFALSFLAMAGLLTWSVYFSRRFEKAIPWTFWREVVSATLGASLMTAPYLAWAFGQVSVFGVFGSILVVPIIPWVMGLGTLAILFPWITAVVLPAQGFLEVILSVARLTDQLPSWMFPEIRLPLWGIFLIYYALFVVWGHVRLSTNLSPYAAT